MTDLDLADLPYEPESPAELLAATHVFAVEVRALGATPWTRRADGLERRTLTLECVLSARFKGVLRVPEGAPFTFVVAQERESEFVVSDYHGLWSHASPAVGTRYLLVAAGVADAAGDPAALMAEGPSRELFPAAGVVNARLATQGEQAWRATLAAYVPQGNTDGDPWGREPRAAWALLTYAWDARGPVGALFGRYLWARVGPPAVLEGVHVGLLPALLALVTAPDANLDLRRALIAALYDATLDRADDVTLLGAVATALGMVLRDPTAAALHHTVAEVQLPNLIFADGGARHGAAALLPDARQREALAGALATVSSDGARRVGAWLAAG